MRAKRVLSIAVTAVVAFAATACGSSDGEEGGGSGDPYVVMISAGGEAGPLTDQIQTAVLSARAAVAYVNANGGIDGRQVELVESPDQADPTKAVTNLRSQIAKDKPDAYVSTPSTVAAAVAPILNQNDIIYMNAGNIPETNDPEGNPLAFNLAAPFDATVDSFMPAIDEIGAEKVAILNGNSTYASTFGKTAEEKLAAAGYDVQREEYDSAALDMTAQISSLQSFDPDVLVFNGYGAPVGYVLDGIKKLGWDVPILADIAVTGTPLVTQDPPDGLLGKPEIANMEIQIAKSMSRATASDVTKAGVERIRAEGSIPSSLSSCLPYDGIILIAAAAAAAGSSDPQDIAAQLEEGEGSEPVETIVYSTYDFSPDSHEASLPEGEVTFVAPSRIDDGQLD